MTYEEYLNICPTTKKYVYPCLELLKLDILENNTILRAMQTEKDRQIDNMVWDIYTIDFYWGEL